MKDDTIYLFEIKKTGNKRKEAQEAFHMLLGDFGMKHSYVIDSFEQAVKIVNTIVSKKAPNEG